MKNKLAASSSGYEPMKPGTKDYQKSNYDDLTDNKLNNDNIDMSMALGEEENNKSKTKTMDQKQEKSSSLPKEAATTTATTATTATTTSSPLPPDQLEVFDSSSDNAMSEMKQIADMGPDEASKVFSHVEEKQQLDPLTTSVDDDTKKAISEDSPNTNPDADIVSVNANLNSERKERSVMETIVEAVEQEWNNIETNTIQVNKEPEKQDRLGENKNSNYNSANIYNYNPFIIGIKFWQAHNVAWINAYNEFLKAWIDNIRLTASTYEEFNSNRNKMLKITEV
jgi:hypothetical protein